MVSQCQRGLNYQSRLQSTSDTVTSFLLPSCVFWLPSLVNRANPAPDHNFLVIVECTIADPPYYLFGLLTRTTTLTTTTASLTAPPTSWCMMMSTSTPTPSSGDGEVPVNIEEVSVQDSGVDSATIETEQQGEELPPVPPVNDSTGSITDDVMNSDPVVFPPQRVTVVGRSRLERKIREMTAEAKQMANTLNNLEHEIRALQKIRRRCAFTVNAGEMPQKDKRFQITTITLLDDSIMAIRMVRERLYTCKDDLHYKIREMEHETRSFELDIEIIYPTGHEGV